MNTNDSLNELRIKLDNPASLAPEEKKKAYIDFLGLVVIEKCAGNKSECARRLGLKPQAVINYLRAGYGPSVYRNIIQTFFTSADVTPVTEEQTDVTCNYDELHLLIAEYQKHIESLDKHIASLESQLAAKDLTIGHLLDIISQKS